MFWSEIPVFVAVNTAANVMMSSLRYSVVSANVEEAVSNSHEWLAPPSSPPPSTEVSSYACNLNVI